MSEARMDLFGDFKVAVSPSGEVVVTSKLTHHDVLRLTPTSAEQLILAMIDRWDEADRLTKGLTAVRKEVESGRPPPPPPKKRTQR